MSRSLAIDLLAVGEILIDFISTDRVDNLREATTFKRYLGGSPANIAANVSRLGCTSALVGKTGSGAFGQFLEAELQGHGVCTDYIQKDHQVRTSIVFVSQSTGTPQFEPNRDADYHLTPEEVPTDAVTAARIVHFSTWPLSREPSRSAMYKILKIAGDSGKIISFDPNYSPTVWSDYQEAGEIIRNVYKHVTITKASLDDARRFFGDEQPPANYIRQYHLLGPRIVVLTMGDQGSLISEDGKLLGHLPARPVEVKDSTGAGDAFWAGFLVALLDGHRLERCLLFAREVAELKLQTVGVLSAPVDREILYANLPEVSSAFSPDDSGWNRPH